MGAGRRSAASARRPTNLHPSLPRHPIEQEVRGREDSLIGKASSRRYRAVASAASPAAALALFALLVAALAGCSTTGLLNALQPRAAVRVTRDQRYASGTRGTLDIYAPRAAKGHSPVVLFLYGGAWDSGRKAQYAFIGDALASAG